MDKKNHIPQKESPPVLPKKKNMRSRFSLRVADEGQARRVEAALEVLIEALAGQELENLRVGRRLSPPADGRTSQHRHAQSNGGKHS